MSVSTTAALLASRAFGRVQWLGAEPQTLVREALMVNVARAPHELARALRVKLLGTTPPDLASEIESVLNQCAYDPLKLAVLAAAGPPEIVGHLVPHELISDAKDRAGEKVIPELHLADAHLHSGASMRLDVFLRAVARSTNPAPVDLYTVYAYDDIGDEYSIGAIVSAVRHFLCLLYASRLKRRIESPPQMMKGFLEGNFWSHARTVACSTGRDLGDRPIQDMMEICSVPIIHGGLHRWDPSQEAKDYIDRISSRGTIKERNLCTGLVAALFLINGFLKSAPGEGLPSFVDRFEQMGLLRDSALMTERAEAVTLAVDAVLTDVKVVGAEFRKSVYADKKATIDSLAHTISSSLRDHLEGFARSTAVQQRARNLSMPVTFLRGQRLVPHDDVSLIYDLEPIWRLALAVERVYLRDNAGRFISAIDVVGNELSMPNWVFVPLLDYLERLSTDGRGLDCVRTCHAGESFVTRLQGIRSVGELVSPTRVVDRIGHALALDEMASDFIIGSCPADLTARDVIEDMCWLAAAEIQPDEAIELIDLVIGELNLSTLGIRPNDFIQAWTDRRTIGGYAKHQLCDSIAGPPTGVYPLNARFAYGTSAAFLLLTHHGTRFPYDLLSTPLNSSLAKAYRQLELKYADAVASHVRALIVSEKIVIEACPTSNMRLAGLPKVSYLPIVRWLEEGVRVSLNSDDPLIFGNSVTEEAALISAHCPDWVLPRLARTAEEACGIGRSATVAETYARAAAMARIAVEAG